VAIPSSFPCETEISEAVNSAEARYSGTAVHEYLHSNLPPQTMCYTQEPIPEILSERTLAQYGSNAPFRHREVIRDWVEDIFVRGGGLDLVEFHTTVERAEKRGDKWVLTLRKAAPGATKNIWWQEVFDALVVATGHFSIPYIPAIPGLVEYDERFPGRIKHSKHFRSVDEFAGKVRLPWTFSGAPRAYTADLSHRKSSLSVDPCPRLTRYMKFASWRNIR
jgi:cation diffusion facilitator CzcD-associated flavoprotein CzcO